MATQQPIHNGTVTSLALNGERAFSVMFGLDGPIGDRHAGFDRHLSGHDGAYIKTSQLQKGARVFNTRSWTGLSIEELAAIEAEIGYDIPIGCLLENITFGGIPNFSQLEPGTRLVFPAHTINGHTHQAILIVWEENGPCRTVGERLENHYDAKGLKTDFVRFAQHKRGVMGFVYSAGPVSWKDPVLVYPPVR